MLNGFLQVQVVYLNCGSNVFEPVFLENLSFFMIVVIAFDGISNMLQTIVSRFSRSLVGR